MIKSTIKNINILAATEQFLEQPHKLLIDGKWVDGIEGKTIETRDPATNKVIAQVSIGGKKDIDEAVIAARNALEGPWSKLTNFERAKLLSRIARLVESNTDLLTEIEVLDNGMPTNIARLTIHNIAEMFDYYGAAAQRIEGTTTPPPRHITDHAEALTYTLREPIGVAGLIVPWNVPAFTAVLKLAPALAAGCTVVMKPSEETPLSALLIGQLCLEAGIPAGVVNIVNGYGSEVGAAISHHTDVDTVSFTGSTKIGREVINAATSNLKKVSLELGGKSPVVIMPDADLELATKGIAMATFFLQGQNRKAGTRIFIHDSVHDELIERVKLFTEQLVIGHGINPATTLGPLISEKQCDQVMKYIEAGLNEGATLLAGGKRLEGDGHFVEPTIFIDCTPDMSIVQDEIFGPVMTVQRFSTLDLDEIARLANDTIYGLSGSVWTQNLSTAHSLVARIRAGHVSINCHGAVGTNIPSGGYGQSGWGREFGQEGLDAFLETKAVTAQLGKY
ncbi:aldehyde dehydrogenase family protein [Aliiglaciecola sp. 3_MG-2023]|uniref:aldehyde dehydrogenase family protein n=1 Tax=Aliiglaciecola sp. 3_MG-2023 TaxID=3062644 RepID=UPI0026E3D32A|nr:aldehyde dehydrogenase family protein [Aliiglaciecola sp. 3_MG-2023]MDO6693095.1 aldehyde dehydrogenase family protein [Aliiglaciecola sp. 3_MG-2023]